MADAEGPLAEFTALRAEILQYNQQQNQMLALQLTIVGAIFGVVVSRPDLAGVLMIVPIISYALCMRYLANGTSIFEIARYIREDLTNRVPGGLHWESWLLANSRESVTYAQVVPLLVTFPGVSTLALSWVLTYLFRQPVPELIGLLLLWITSGIAAVQQIVLVLRLRNGRWPVRNPK